MRRRKIARQQRQEQDAVAPALFDDDDIEPEETVRAFQASV